MKRENSLNIFAVLISRVTLCLLLSFVYGNVLMAEESLLKSEYSYRRYTTQDGLPSMNMKTVFKDSKGLLWQGTLKGSSNFDGFNFKPFSLDKFPFVDKIEEVNGKIRFFRDKDLFYPESETLIHLSDTLTLNPYNSYLLPVDFYIFENQENKKYFVKIENDKISEVMDIPQLQGLNRCKVYLDLEQNSLYIPINREKKVYIYNLQNKALKSIENVIIESFIKHSNLGLLGIGNDGIFKIENGKAVLYIPLKFEMQNKVAKETQNGDMYIKDFFNIYRISGKKVEHLCRNSAVTIWDMTLDNDENLWIATHKGLYNFFHFDFKNYQIPNHTIRSVTQDDNGTYWFAGDNEDIFTLTDGYFRPAKYPLNQKLQSISFNIAFSHNNMTYFLIQGGILIHENNRFYWADIPVENQYYYRMAVYKDNLLVIGSNGLIEITPYGKVVKTFTEEELKQQGCQSLAVDKNNRIIVGGNDGISIIENEKIRLLKNNNTILSDIVCVDNHNYIFSAAKKYLNHVTNDSVQTIYSFDNDYIMGLLPLDNENMIISTLKGFYIFNTKNYFERNKIQILFYNHNNGMDGIEPAFSKIYLDKEGKVWMVTLEKMICFDPQKLIRQITPPNFIFQNFFVSKDNVKWEEIENLAKAKLFYKNKNFKISFIGLNYSAADNVRYHYRLLGFQNEWSEPVKQREVTFNNLPPGNYIFEIYADAGTDESRSETQSIVFSIKPAFWQTTWFVVGSIIFLILLSTGIALYIQRRKNRALMEKLRAEKELNELRINSIRLKAIPHFNANVLSAIEYSIANRTKEEAMRILGIYSDFTFKTLSDVDKAARPLSEELAYVKMYLDLEKVRFLDKFDFCIEVDDEVDRSIQLPNMILHTYCENAIKHGLMPLKSGGLLVVQVTQHGQTVCVNVEDNGVGRDYAGQNSHLHSTKQGLSILNRQIEIYNHFNREKINQQVEDLYKDGKPGGTRFTVEVPLNFEYIN